MPHKITPMIRATTDGPSQAAYYCGIFPSATITKSNPVVTSFEIFGQSLAILTGGPNPNATINPSISFSLRITDMNETQRIRDLLVQGGSVLMDFASYPRSTGYGRCTDIYGVSRQVMYDARPTAINTLIPSLMYTGSNNGKAKEAMELYTSIFPASHIDTIHPYTEGQNEIVGNIAHAEFTLVNQPFIAAESGQNHAYTFTNGISLAVSCKDQAEVDTYRKALVSDGGHEGQCGRCLDRYGVSRQIVPVQLPEALFHPNPEQSRYAMNQMMNMSKIVIDDLYLS